jgi:hypothetical protein
LYTIGHPQDKTAFGASPGSVFARIRRFGIAYTKAFFYKERNEAKRPESRKVIAKEKVKDLVFVD